MSGRPTTPKPVRAGLAGRRAVEVDAAEALAGEGERSMEAGGETWTVRLRGRARGHVSRGVADLMLLGFHRPEEADPARETLVLGRSLEDLSVDELRTAWERSRPARDPFESSELFPGTRRKRNRGR